MYVNTFRFFRAIILFSSAQAFFTSAPLASSNDFATDSSYLLGGNFKIDGKSFSHSADEALARKLHDEENKSPRRRVEGLKPETARDDEVLARKLQREEDEAVQVRTPQTTSGDTHLQDSVLAKRLQEEDYKTSATSESSTAFSSSSLFSSLLGWPTNPVDRHITSRNSCARCHKSISGQYLTVGSPPSKFHPACFRCAGCDKPIQGSYLTKESDIDCYHRDCYESLFLKACDLCGRRLTGRYNCHGYFTDLQNYCAEHSTQPLRQCFCCHIKEPFSNHFGGSSSGGNEPFPTLPDGRLICWRCIDFVVVDSEEARPLYLAAVNFMEHSLGLSIPAGMREVPILAVDLPSLNDQLSLQASSSTHGRCAHTDPQSQSHGVAATGGGGASLTRGLTLTSVSEVRYVQPGGAWSHNWLTGGTAYGSNTSSSMVTLKRTCSVTAVLVLCGLPKDLTASILAHEAMHVWCKLRPEPLLNLPPEVEEGICQLVAYEYLDKYAEESSTPWETKLRAYFKYQIQTDPSPVYGDGFRKAAEGSAALGFSLLIEHVAASRNFPTI